MGNLMKALMAEYIWGLPNIGDYVEVSEMNVCLVNFVCPIPYVHSISVYRVLRVFVLNSGI